MTNAKTHFIYEKRNSKQFAIAALEEADYEVTFTDNGDAIVTEPKLQIEHYDNKIAEAEAEIAKYEAMTDEQYRESSLKNKELGIQKIILRTHQLIEEETILRQVLELYKNFNTPIATHTLGGKTNPRGLIIEELQGELSAISSSIRSCQGHYEILKEDMSLEDAGEIRLTLIENARREYEYNVKYRESEIKNHNEKVKFLADYLQAVEEYFK